MSLRNSCPHAIGRRQRGSSDLYLGGLARILAILCISTTMGARAFVSNVHPVAKPFVAKDTMSSRYPSTTQTIITTRTTTPKKHSSQTQLNMFMGSDGGILGIGTPELFTILLVGYFVLGPSDLYKLTKEIGKFVQNVRTFTAEATSTFETNLESQLQLEEIRKAQRELNEAFSFRRSINVEADSDPFEVNAQSPRMPEQAELLGTTAVASATVAVGATEEEVAAAPKKKIRRRRIKKKVEVSDTVTGGSASADEVEDPFCVPNSASSSTSTTAVTNNIPDLSMDEYDFLTESEESADRALREANEQLRREAMEEEAAQRRKERLDRLQQTSSSSSSSNYNEADNTAAASRFQAQLSGNWNEQILSKGDELSPLANIMERLALLEEEKQAADQRLQEEFRLREENEERYYREKRKLLEEAAAQVQADVYYNPTNNGATTASKASTDTTTITKA